MLKYSTAKEVLTGEVQRAEDITAQADTNSREAWLHVQHATQEQI